MQAYWQSIQKRLEIRPGLNEPTILELAMELRNNLFAGHKGSKRLQQEMAVQLVERLERGEKENPG